MLWAGIVVLLTALQVALGLLSFAVVGLGLLHGINALALFAVAAMAAHRAVTTKAPQHAAAPDRAGVA